MLKNKKILFFGTNNDISKAILESLIQQHAKVIFVIQNEISDLKTINQTSENHFFLNYYSIETVSDFFLNQLKDEKGFDGFVFGGGIGGVRPIKLTKTDFVQDMFDANVFSFLEIMRQIVKKGFMNDGASIIGLSSVSSSKGLKSKVAYSASKAALEAAIRGAAAELSDRKIRVNAIQKGWVTSDMDLDFIKDNRSLNDDSDFKKQLLGAIEPQELANLVSFLLSDQVKTITGTSILLDGGYTL